ncbi:MAG: ribosome maturation factor RimM, partial [Desulfovibrio sp.]|nr:ribosome maturation factor RimM [Desulfovibrio sp.]
MKRFLEMGRIGKAHGVKGEADLIWHGETVPEKGMEIFLEDASGLLPSPQIIRSLRRSNGRIFVAFEGVEDRTAVEKLRGKKVFADRETLPPLEEGEAYLADLPGWKVFLEDGEYLG